MKIDRKPIFQAVRELRDGQGFTLEEVRLLDAAIDRAFAAIVPASAPVEPPRAFNEAAFFDTMRGSKALGPTLSTDEVEGCQAIIGACGAGRYGLSWTAYALATACHETAGTMRPIREYGRGRGRKYGVAGKHGQVAYGRGYVQLTWDYNYATADQKLGLGGRLTADYDLALDPKIAADIMVRGMAEGWFTGKKLADYLPGAGPATRAQFEQARRIINGTDKMALIAGHALEFQRALQAGGM
jgi:hypothetical protein